MISPRFLLACGVAGAALACGSPKTPATPDAPADAAADADTAVASSKKPIPAALRSFEANGEGMCEAPATPDWQTAKEILAQATTTWTKLRPMLAADGAPVTLLERVGSLLDTYSMDVARLDVRAAETDANSMNATIPDFFDLYAFPVPSDVLRLDAAYRRVQIEAEHSDFPAAAVAAETAKGIWARLRAGVAARAATRSDIVAAKSVVDDVDSTFGAMTSAITAQGSTDTQKASSQGLDLVDVLEQIYQ